MRFNVPARGFRDLLERWREMPLEGCLGLRGGIGTDGFDKDEVLGFQDWEDTTFQEARSYEFGEPLF